MVSSNRRIKLFNRLLVEFMNDINPTEPKIKIKDIKYLDTYKNEVNLKGDRFFKCDDSVFSDIELCTRLKLHTNKPSNDNKINTWKYLHNLYILTIESVEDKEEFVNKSKAGIEGLQVKPESQQIAPVQGLEALGGLGLNDIIADIAKQVSESLEGQDVSKINPMELMSSMMAGNKMVGGIDFGSILKKTTESIQSKVNSGELDLEALKEQTTGMMQSCSTSPDNINLVTKGLNSI